MSTPPQRIADTARRIRDAFESRHPKVHHRYASKALSAIKALRLIKDEGLSIEVNSGGELFRAKMAGFAPDQIIFNGVAKSEEEVRAALSPPIKAINIDSLFELSRVIAVARGMGQRAQHRAARRSGGRQPDLAGQSNRLGGHQIRHQAERAGAALS